MRYQFLASQRQNLSGNLYLMDALNIGLDKESLLNALSYDPDEFKDKINREILLCTNYYIKSTKCFEKLLLDQC